MSERLIQESIQKLAGTYLKDLVEIILCTVDKVDKQNSKCDCTPIGGDAATSLPNVLLSAENNNGLVVFPKVGSTVIVALSIRNTAFVLMYSEVESIQFMDGSFGGIPKLLDPQDTDAGVLARLNKIETFVDGLKTFVNALTLPVSGSTAGPPSTPFSETITQTTRAQLENTLITQGKN